MNLSRVCQKNVWFVWTIKQKSVSNKPAEGYHWRCEFKVDFPPVPEGHSSDLEF